MRYGDNVPKLYSVPVGNPATAAKPKPVPSGIWFNRGFCLLCLRGETAAKHLRASLVEQRLHGLTPPERRGGRPANQQQNREGGGMIFTSEDARRLIEQYQIIDWWRKAGICFIWLMVGVFLGYGWAARAYLGG